MIVTDLAPDKLVQIMASHIARFLVSPNQYQLLFLVTREGTAAVLSTVPTTVAFSANS